MKKKFRLAVAIAALATICAGLSWLVFSTPKTPIVGCGTIGDGHTLQMEDGSYFVLRGEGRWYEVSYYKGKLFYRSEGNADWGDLLSLGEEKTSLGPLYDEKGNFTRREWIFIRCGKNEFTVWKTADLEKSLPPTPTANPTKTPVAIFGP